MSRASWGRGLKHITSPRSKSRRNSWVPWVPWLPNQHIVAIDQPVAECMYYRGRGTAAGSRFGGVSRDAATLAATTLLAHFASWRHTCGSVEAIWACWCLHGNPFDTYNSSVLVAAVKHRAVPVHRDGFWRRRTGYNSLLNSICPGTDSCRRPAWMRAEAVTRTCSEGGLWPTQDAIYTPVSTIYK